MFIFSEKEQLRFAVVNVYKNGVYGYPCKDRAEAEWRAAMLSGRAYRIVVKPKVYGYKLDDISRGLQSYLRRVGA